VVISPRASSLGPLTPPPPLRPAPHALRPRPPPQPPQLSTLLADVASRRAEAASLAEQNAGLRRRAAALELTLAGCDAHLAALTLAAGGPAAAAAAAAAPAWAPGGTEASGEGGGSTGAAAGGGSRGATPLGGAEGEEPRGAAGGGGGGGGGAPAAGAPPAAPTYDEQPPFVLGPGAEVLHAALQTQGSAHEAPARARQEAPGRRKAPQGEGSVQERGHDQELQPTAQDTAQAQQQQHQQHWGALQHRLHARVQEQELLFPPPQQQRQQPQAPFQQRAQSADLDAFGAPPPASLPGGAPSPGPPRSYSADWATLAGAPIAAPGAGGAGRPPARPARPPPPASLLGRPGAAADYATAAPWPVAPLVPHQQPQPQLLQGHALPQLQLPQQPQPQLHQQQPQQQGRPRFVGYQVTTEGSGLVRTSSAGSAASGESLGPANAPGGPAPAAHALAARPPERAAPPGWGVAGGSAPAAAPAVSAGQPAPWPRPPQGAPSASPPLAPPQRQASSEPPRMSGPEASGGAAAVGGSGVPAPVFVPPRPGESVVAWYRSAVSRLGDLMGAPPGAAGGSSGALAAAADGLLDALHAAAARDG
jgi:hypothetical protein